MTRNLAIGCNGTGSTYGTSHLVLTLTSADTDIEGNFTTPNIEVTSDSYDIPKLTCSSTYGAYYNYATTTAGTIVGGSNTNEAEHSICPIGWRLPTHLELGTITSYASTFQPTAGGYWYNGTLNTTGTGWWISSTASSATNRHDISYNGSAFNNNSSASRLTGEFVRCIAN